MNGTNEKQGMSIIVKRITRMTVSIIFLYGVYILLHGHLTPGGGFAGGVIVALSFIHYVLAFGREEALKHLKEAVFHFLEPAGGLLFLAVAFMGVTGGFFFLNIYPKGQPFHLFSAVMIILANIAIFIKVGAGLFSAFLALSMLDVQPKKGD